MTTINLNRDDSKHVVAVRKMAEHFETSDCNFNGEKIHVEINEDFTCVDDRDELRGATLFAAVTATINECNGTPD